MSFNIRTIREISSDPLTKFTNELAKKLSKFLTAQQIDRLEDKEDIYSDGQDVETVIKYNGLQSQQKFNFDVEYYSVSEPDGDKVKLMLRGRNMGNTITDASGFGNHGIINGDPVLVDGTPFDYGIHTQGVKSVALRINRPTSINVNKEYISIPHNTNLQVSGISTGISYFIRFKIHSIAQQGGRSRRLFEKTDGSNPDNGVQIRVTDTGRLVVILKRATVEYKKQTATSTIAVNTVYDIFITYAVSGNEIKVYINNVDTSLSDFTGDTNWHATTSEMSLNIFRRGEGSTSGHTYGDLYDFILFREKVVSSTEVSRHYANKLTLADIPYGQVAVSNYSSSIIV
jgi:hypothetical protein